ncbi:MAG: hypothetical protein VXW32_15625 [Myxococcota bacterium]|nr:hypothetical protein [Myxococcota bacterium]
MKRLLNHPLAAKLLRFWPTVVVVVVLCVLVSPFFQAGDLVFSSDLRGDSLATPWIYDFTAREIAEGRWPATLTDFDFPIPLGEGEHTRSPFATVPPIEAVVMAPLAWWLGWPAQWNGMLAVGLLINSLGCLALAHALGCRRLGLVVAAVAGACCGPVWIEALEGRTNCFYPGLTMLGLAIFMRVLPRGESEALLPRLFFGVLGAAVGWLSFVIYPPGVALWIPLGIALVSRHLLQRRWIGLRELFLPGILLLSAYLLSFPQLAEMQQSGWVLQEFSHNQCAPPGRVLSLAELFKREVGEPFRGLPLGLWFLGCLVLLKREGRWFWGFVLSWVVLYALMSLGPCPVWERTEWQETGGALWGWPNFMEPVWWMVSFLHYYDRLAAAGGLLLGLAAAVGAEEAWSGRTRRSRIPLAGLIAYGLLQMLSIHQNSVLMSENWTKSPQSVSAEFLQEAGPGAVVELPYDQRYQFLSVLQSSKHPRVNTLRPAERSPNIWRGRVDSISGRRSVVRYVVEWFDDLGRGRSPQPSPSRSDIAEAGIRWIVFEPGRCLEEGPFVKQAACSDEVLDTLEAALGRGRELSDGARAWEVAGSW